MKINLNSRQMEYLMNEYRIHQVTPNNNNIVGGYIMVLHHHQSSRSVLLLTGYSMDEGLLWQSDKKVIAVVIWADFGTLQELEALIA